MPRTIIPARTRAALQMAWQRLDEQHTTVASTKRIPPINLGTGKRGNTPQPYLSTVYCTPLAPADGERVREAAFRLQEQLGKNYTVLHTTVSGNPDIQEGDILVVDGSEYPVRQVSVWEWTGGSSLELLVEATKPTIRTRAVGGTILLAEDGAPWTFVDIADYVDMS